MKRLALLWFVVFSCLGGTAHSETRYNLILLRPLPGHTACAAFAINNKSEVVGYSGESTITGSSSPVYWGPSSDPAKNYAPQNIGTFGDNCGVAFAINDGSYVVGRSGLIYKGFRAFLWDPVTAIIKQLGDPPPTDTQSWDINIHGVAAGNSGGRACLFELGKSALILDPAPTVNQSFALSINDSGLVAGRYDQTAVIWDQGVMQALAPTYKTSSAKKVNNAGEVIGNLNIESSTLTQQAFIWDKFKGLRTYESLKNTVFNGINNKAKTQVVGNYTNPTVLDQRAIIWEEGKPSEDLNFDVITRGGAILVDANGINDKGEIAGAATQGGVLQGFLLLPKTTDLTGELELLLGN